MNLNQYFEFHRIIYVLSSAKVKNTGTFYPMVKGTISVDFSNICMFASRQCFFFWRMPCNLSNTVLNGIRVVAGNSLHSQLIPAHSY